MPMFVVVVVVVIAVRLQDLEQNKPLNLGAEPENAAEPWGNSLAVPPPTSRKAMAAQAPGSLKDRASALPPSKANGLRNFGAGVPSGGE